MALTSAGQRAVSGSDDKTLRVWDVQTGQCTATLEGHCSSSAYNGYTWVTICSVQFTPDADYAFASAAVNGVLRRWDLRGGGRGVGVTEPRAARYTNAKVLLVGESGVGKTGLARRMATGEFEETQSIDGHWATRLKATQHHTDEKWATRLMLNEDTTDDGTRREIWLWDFAGQADYRLIHQLFMDETSLAVLVFNPQSEEVFDSLGRWDTDIARAARKSYNKLLVAGRIDRGVLIAGRDDLDEFLKLRSFDGYVETSAKSGTGCEELVQAICQNIDWERLTTTASNAKFDRLKNEILQLRDAGTALIRLSELNQRLRLTASDLDFELPELTTVIGHLASPGLVWKLDFGGFVLLQPERINSYAGAVARELRSQANQLGEIAETALTSGDLKFEGIERLNEEDESVVLQAMHQTFVDKGVCIRRDTGNGTKLVFPAYFGVERPEEPDSPPLLATYEFSGFLDDVYATLVVRFHHTPGFTRKKLWKDFAQFDSETGSRVCVQLTRGKEGKGSLMLHCDHDTDEDTRVVFSRYLHEHLAMKASDIERSRHYVCAKCGKPFLDHEEVRDVIKAEGADAFVDCPRKTCPEKIDLWDEIEKKFASDEFRDKVRVMQEASKAAIDNESRELILVGHAFAIAGEAGQIYRPVLNPDHGIDGEIEFKDYEGHASGKRLYLQLKSGDSHLKYRQRDGRHVFQIKKPRWAEYWIAQAYPVMLVIRTSDETIRWMNATEYLKERQESGDWPVTQIEFDGEDLTLYNLLKLRSSILGPHPNSRDPAQSSDRKVFCWPGVRSRFVLGRLIGLSVVSDSLSLTCLSIGQRHFLWAFLFWRRA